MNSVRRFGRTPAVAFLIPLALLVLPSCAKDDDPAGPGQTVNIPAESTFDRDAEGWTISGDASDYWFPQGGNGGGYVVGVDELRAGRWYWEAPPTYYGNASAAFGRSLTFDLYWSETNPGSASPLGDDVILSNGALTLVHTLSEVPGTSWTTYSVALDESGGWTHRGTGQAATNSDIQNVLGSLNLLRIRGEYRSGPEQGGLDNVRFGVAQ